MDHQHISVGHIFLPCTEGWMSQTINQKTKPKKQTHTRKILASTDFFDNILKSKWRVTTQQFFYGRPESEYNNKIFFRDFVLMGFFGTSQFNVWIHRARKTFYSLQSISKSSLAVRVTANIANKVSNSEPKLNVTVTNSYLCSLDMSALMTIYLKTYVPKFSHFPVMSMLWPNGVFMRIFPVRNYKFPRQPCSTSCWPHKLGSVYVILFKDMKKGSTVNKNRVLICT